MCVLPGRLASPTQLVVEPLEQVPERLGAGDDVEWRWERAALIKVTHPQLCSGKLPLDVCMVLEGEGEFKVYNDGIAIKVANVA